MQYFFAKIPSLFNKIFNPSINFSEHDDAVTLLLVIHPSPLINPSIKPIINHSSSSKNIDKNTIISLQINTNKRTLDLYRKNIDENNIFNVLKKKKIIKPNLNIPMQLQKDLYNLLLMDNKITIKNKYY